MSQTTDFTHLSLDVEDGIATVLLDRAGATMNTISPELSDDLEALLDHLEADDRIEAVVLGSGKPDSFVAGADIYFLETLESADEAIEVLRQAQRAFLRIELLSAYRGKPVVAAIHGPALGGGLELALACSSRVATDHPKTRLGQPEVQIGLMPGAGGTQRLPRLVGLEAALDLVLTGRQISARRALAIGLVDELAGPEQLLELARDRARRLIDGAVESPRGTITDRLRRTATETTAGRRFVFAQAEKKMRATTKGNYPAPPVILDAVRVGMERGPGAGYLAELQGFGRLLETPEAKALMSIFFGRQELKHDRGADADPRPVEKVGIVGGGLMGGGIASVNVLEADVATRVKEIDDEAVAKVLGHVEREVSKRRERRRITDEKATHALGLASGSVSWEGFEDVDLFVEAVFEDLDLKRSILAEIQQLAPEAIFASNTSSLPISSIAEGSAAPERVIGMHYFSPVEKMPLLEVIVTPETADWVTATCVEFGKRQGKTVITVNDGPGFYTTRILVPYMNEVGNLLVEGVSIEAIDKAMVRWGFPVGPVTLTDEVGIDVGAKIAVVMREAFGDRLEVPAMFERLIADGRKGRKVGRGFYRYEDGKKKGVDDTVLPIIGAGAPLEMPAEEIQDRLALLMVNEAVLCLQDEILRSPRDGDMGAVFGLGFPPFRGGPFMWIDQVGASEIVERMERLAETHGPRYAPAELLRHHAEANLRFRA
jgi:3-hydroxyacyl-CoA dehydrogenase/enoyl-CoA hydratase/3-hydroxybutyryl-CoA epimerase